MGTKIYTKAERERIEREGHAKKRHSVIDVAPPEEKNALLKLDNATKALAEVRDMPSAKKLMDAAAAAEIYARKARLGEDAIKHAQGIKYAAEIKLGEYLSRLPEAKRGPKSELITEPGNKSKLEVYEDAGITPKLAAEAQRLAALPDESKAQLARGEIKPSIALRDLRRSELGAKLAALPAGQFRVIYADPPWKYGDERTGLEKADTAAAAQYPTMPTSDICALDIRGMSAADSVLFLWATFPLLEDGLEVMKAWGFDYKTAIVWDKQRSNIGNYHDASAELLLIGVRGSCPIEINSRPKQVQSIARGRHSAKPEEFRALIDSLYPSGPRVELFRRGVAPTGWTVWGNEATTEGAA